MIKNKWVEKRINKKPKRKYITKKIIAKRLEEERQLKLSRAKMFIVLAVSMIAMCIVLGFIEDYKKETLEIINDKSYIIKESQEKKVVIEEVIVKDLSTEQQIRQIAKLECDKRSLGDYCIQDLIAIAWKESKFNCNTDGDSGKSKGCFQIHQGYHPEITTEQAEDLNFAISWTLNRMQHYGYPEFRSYSIMKHNGTPFTTKTLAYLQSINNYIKTIN